MGILLGLVVAVVATFGSGCGSDDEQVIDELCAKWDQCFADQIAGQCMFDEFIDGCANSDEIVDHLAGCLDLSCDQLLFGCFSGMPRCDPSSSSGSQPWLPWLPRRDEEDVVSTPAPGSGP